MSILRNLQRQSFKTLSPLLQSHPYKNVVLRRDVPLKCISSNPIQSSSGSEDSTSSISPWNGFSGWPRSMSTAGGRSMRSKVERRMRKESGKTLREIRRAQKLRKKLMTDEERLIYNLRRAKKKVALLLQKLKKYELPELPAPRHDPELLTAEQLQAYKKIGFRNKNYVPVGVRGVFGGVVQNMHLHWKFHETVQVCCDNFPKEKIKEMATMLARLSGGIVINIHDVKTIIMFRGRNYRQPKNLIPINTLTKRKALFKARFEQALDSQKLNIKKIEQQLRRMGVNPEDPVAMASIQRVASTFFNAIDRQEGSPYVFQGEKQFGAAPTEDMKQSEEPPVDSDQEELDQFIAEIEDAADKEWAVEEAAEKEELSKMRYWNREDFAGRFRRFDDPKKEDFDSDVRGARGWKHMRGRQRTTDTDDEGSDVSEDDEEWDSNDVRDLRTPDSDGDDSDEAHNEFKAPRMRSGKLDFGRAKNNNNKDFKRNAEEFRRKVDEEDSGSEDTLDDLEDVRGARGWKHMRGRQRTTDTDDEGSDVSEDDEEWDSNDVRDLRTPDSDGDDSDEAHNEFKAPRMQSGKLDFGRAKNNNNKDFKRNAEEFRRKVDEEDSGSEDTLDDLEDVRGARGWKHMRGRQRTTDTDDEGSDVSEDDEEWNSNDVRDLRTPDSDGDDSDEAHNEFKAPRMQSGKLDFGRAKNNNNKDFRRNAEEFRRKVDEEDSGSEDMLDDLEDAMWESDAEEEHDSRTSRMASNDYRSSSDDDEHLYCIKRESKNARNLVNDHENDADYSESDEGQDEFRESRIAKQKHGQIRRANNNQGCMRNAEANFSRKMIEEESEPENTFSDSKVGMWESDDEGYSKVSRAVSNDYRGGGEEEYHHKAKNEMGKEKDKRMKTPKQVDETWDSD